MRTFLFFVTTLSFTFAAFTQPEEMNPDSEILETGTYALHLDHLLSDPVPDEAEFKYIRERRRWLAEHSDRIESFESVADEFASVSAFYSAVGILWFAEKMAPSEETSTAYQEQMKDWIAEAAEINRSVDEGLQLFESKRYQEAMDIFSEATQAHPYNDRAHYARADAYLRVYQIRTDASPHPISLTTRANMFRNAYRHYLFNLELDPLYFDSYYGISELREMFPDDREFIARTQGLTQRALDFRTGIIPILNLIDDGQRDSGLFLELGVLLENLGIEAYAAYAYQVAIHLDPDFEQARDRWGQLTHRLDKGAN